jgi:hypothetical protein
MKRLTIVSLLPLLLAGCYSVSDYKGDGTLVDHGHRFVTNKYTLTLGHIDLTRAQELHFRMSGLPRREFVVGVKLDPVECSLASSEIRITIDVRVARGPVVIHEDHALRELVWTRNEHDRCNPLFGYVRGAATELPDRIGNVRMQPIIAGADGGQGSYFHSRESASYDVTIGIQPDAQAPSGSHHAKIIVDDNGPVP